MVGGQTDILLGLLEQGVNSLFIREKTGNFALFCAFWGYWSNFKKEISLLKIISGSSLNSLKQITGKKQGYAGKIKYVSGSFPRYIKSNYVFLVSFKRLLALFLISVCICQKFYYDRRYSWVLRFKINPTLCSLFSAHGMPVPELSVKPFVKYGVGIFKVQREKAIVDIGTQSGTVNERLCLMMS